ncbi:hypothetical protein A3C89_03500 [Candidatus Kaiserbacteria bacterium RIFCSPHIGHO2_02_FULL_50_50]|uniref:Metal ABC transporter permease n=1 Tax=Candidatus Kaiserbacteria bacterium RIFCSPHIGHO2_02_FULL_50_50 TaxID=1798492 RepID=A0A1F6DC04_9BACT|nr:MAG: hypothetical protein A3C89_03500 [Candidatus Kaiserbacteria bacterium RIFCSPHIGHO2_02_FULL_50_50]OGG88526.1 MAG: hypothetical protein A3G62_03390 [Candidatus Kaiserbacteria bacterium RIFCSPLOWO2_12_FULL_50_10]
MFTYTFLEHAILASLITAVVAPTIGFFLVLRREALMADTLAHVSLAGVAAGILIGWNPLATALIVATSSSLAIEHLKTKRVASEWALALFLYGSLAVAIILFSLGSNVGSKVTSFLFGNLLTVTTSDLLLMAALGAVVMATVAFFFQPLLTLTFDETFARTIGLPVRRLTAVLAALTAAVITLAIPTLGVLLIGAMISIPVIAALQLRASAFATLLTAIGIALIGTLFGLTLSLTLNIAPSGSIVLTLIGITLLIRLSLAIKK